METSVGSWFQGPLVLSIFAPNYSKSYNISITRSLRFNDYFIPFFLTNTQNGSQFKGVFCAKGEVSFRRVLLKTLSGRLGYPACNITMEGTVVNGGVGGWESLNMDHTRPHQLQGFHSCCVNLGVCQQTQGNHINSIHLEHITIYLFLLGCFTFKQARLPNLGSLFHSCCVNSSVCRQHKDTTSRIHKNLSQFVLGCFT